MSRNEYSVNLKLSNPNNMQTILSNSTLLSSILILLGFVTVAALFIAKSQAEFEAIKGPKKALFITTSGYHSDMIQQFISDRWKLQTDIRECEALNEMAAKYWHIEKLEEYYKDAVPDQLLIEHIDELFAAHSRYALALKNKLELETA